MGPRKIMLVLVAISIFLIAEPVRKIRGSKRSHLQPRRGSDSEQELRGLPPPQRHRADVADDIPGDPNVGPADS